jgi:transposase
VKNLIADIDCLEYKKIKLVMDRGFYSEDNVNSMLAAHLKFLMGVRVSLVYVQKALAPARESMRGFDNYHPAHELYAHTETITWEYKHERPYKGDTLEEGRRMYLHIYYSSAKAVDDETAFNVKLITLKDELESGNAKTEHDKLYAKYFEVKRTPKRGAKITAKQKAIDNAKKNFGYFAMISNEIKDPIKALELYRSKDLVEKAFENLKGRLSFKRALASSEQSLDGKLFVEFVALIIMSFIKRKMQESELFKKYTMHEMLDQIDLIECFEQKDRKLRYGEITQKQRDIYEVLGIEPPA